MKKFDNINDFKSWADTNGIKYEIKEEFNDEFEKDKIIKTSIEEGANINLEETITVYVSKGTAVTVPNFNGMTKSEAKKECDNLGINCTFKEEYSTKSSGKVINQSIAEGTQISKGDTITITIATDKKTTSNSNKTSSSGSSSRPSSGSSNNSVSSGGSSGGTTTPSTPTCNTYKFTAGGAGSNGGETCSIMKNTANNSKLNIECDYVTSCPNGNASNGAVCSYSHTPGSMVSSCDTIKITIVNK